MTQDDPTSIQTNADIMSKLRSISHPNEHTDSISDANLITSKPYVDSAADVDTLKTLKVEDSK